MENNDILNNDTHPLDQQPDNSSETTAQGEATTEVPTFDEAVTINGGTAEEATVPADSSNQKDREIAELKDKYLRLYADFENFRRRTAKEKGELRATASEDLMVALLPVVDDFERALKSIETTTNVATLQEGVSLIQSKLAKTLEGKGLKPMQAQGQTFDADLHESVTQFPAPSEDLKGKVIDEIEKGYYLNDKVIRFAKVIIGS